MIGLLCLFALNPKVADDALKSCGAVTASEYSGCEWKDVRSASASNFRAGTLNLISCRFAFYKATGGSFGGVGRFDKGTLIAIDTNFSECQGSGPSCFYVEGTVRMQRCEFRDNLRSTGAFTTFSYDYGMGCLCIQNRENSICSMTECWFFNNDNGCLGIARYGNKDQKIEFDFKSCTFQDGAFYKSSGTQNTRGGQILVDYGKITLTDCTFTSTSSHTSQKEGWALLVEKSPTVILDDCTFTTEKADANVCSVLLATPKLTMKKCSFQGDSLHIKHIKSTEEEKPISVTIQECLQFSNALEGATENIEFVSGDEGVSVEDIIFDNGQGCPVPPEPTTEEPDEPAGDTSVDGGEEPGASDSDPEGSGGEPIAPSGKPTDDDDDDEDDDDDDGSKGDKNGLSGGEIAAIVIVVLIVIAAIVAVLLFFLVFRRRYGSKSSGTGEEATSEVTTTEEVVTGTGAVNQQYGGDFGLWDSEAPESDQGSKEQ